MTAPLPAEREAEIRARMEAATDGSWAASHDFPVDGVSCVILEPAGSGCAQAIVVRRREDAEFIAHAPDDTGDLLAALDHARAEVAQLRETLAAEPSEAEVEAVAAWLYRTYAPHAFGGWTRAAEITRDAWREDARAVLTAAYAARREEQTVGTEE